MISNVEKESSLTFLKANSLGRLGCVLENGEPYVVPVNYLFEGDNLYIHSLPGQKISAMRTNPKVCLQSDMIAEQGFDWFSVIAFGEFEEVKDRTLKSKILIDFYERFPRFTPVEAEFDKKISMEDIVVFRIKIERLTGVEEIY